MIVQQPILLIAGLLGASAVAAGAVGAHVLGGYLTDQQMAWFETAADLHLAHALALLAIARRRVDSGTNRDRIPAWLFVAGVGLFSGSLYALALGADRAVAALTPFGGLFLISGWVLVAVSALGAPRRSLRHTA